MSSERGEIEMAKGGNKRERGTNKEIHI